MNIKMIKERASQIQNMNRTQYMRILLMIVLLELIPNIFNIGEDILSRLLYLVMSIVFLTVSHGYIVSSLKMVRNQSQSLKDDDAFVGFKRFKELFSTYILINIFMMAVLFIVAYILLVIIGVFLSQSLQGISGEMLLTGNYVYILSYILKHSPQTLSMFVLCYFVLLIILFFVSSYLFAVPYLLERFHMKNLKAMKASFSLMKGHIFEYFKLYLSFFGWIFLMVIIQSLIAELLSFLPVLGSLIAAIIAGVISVYSYLPRFHLAQAIFFEELAYHRYEQTNNYNGDDQYV